MINELYFHKKETATKLAKQLSDNHVAIEVDVIPEFTSERQKRLQEPSFWVVKCTCWDDQKTKELYQRIRKVYKRKILFKREDIKYA